MTSLKAKIAASALGKAAAEGKYYLRSAGKIAYVSGTFLLGWCSYDKLKGYLHEYDRKHRMVKARENGVDITPKTYNGKRLLDLQEANDLIANAIDTGTPFMAGRYGSVELMATWIARDDGKGFIYPHKKALKTLCSNAGFFPHDETFMIKFAQLMKWATSQVNLMAIWWNDMEEYMLRTYGNNPDYCRLHNMDPFLAANPWSAKLEGKKVVVIHPFADTIRTQYAKRELLFPDRNVLPQFDLRVVKAVQTIAGNQDNRFADWFEALDYMYDQAMTQDFDVAIIGCGAYGFPLAAKLKAAGKIAIHLGGVTQLLFGIKGKRWEMYRNGYEKLMQNPEWVRPLDVDVPKRFDTIEGGCYW